MFSENNDKAVGILIYIYNAFAVELWERSENANLVFEILPLYIQCICCGTLRERSENQSVQENQNLLAKISTDNFLHKIHFAAKSK